MTLFRYILAILTIIMSFTSVVNAEEKIPTPTTPFINYDLAYPGILPDHPLYVLKELRDKIAVAMTYDAETKLKFYLKQADKGILASAILVDKGKTYLAVQTALKAEHNYTLLVQQVDSLRGNIKMDTQSLLEISALKHQEVLLSLAARVSGDEKKKFIAVANLSKKNLEAVRKHKLFNDNNQYQSL